MGRIGGQLRAVSGTLLGYDMTAAIAVGSAMGVNPAAVAEFLPEIEAIMVRSASGSEGGNHG